MTFQEDYYKAEKEFRELIKSKLFPYGSYAYDAIICLLDNNNPQSAFMVWRTYMGVLKIKLTEKEEKIVENWYWFFGK